MISLYSVFNAFSVLLWNIFQPGSLFLRAQCNLMHFTAYHNPSSPPPPLPIIPHNPTLKESLAFFPTTSSKYLLFGCLFMISSLWAVCLKLYNECLECLQWVTSYKRSLYNAENPQSTIFLIFRWTSGFSNQSAQDRPTF